MKVVIELEFESDDIEAADVYNYLNELMEDGSLRFYKRLDVTADVIDSDGEYVKTIH